MNGKCFGSYVIAENYRALEIIFHFCGDRRKSRVFRCYNCIGTQGCRNLVLLKFGLQCKFAFASLAFIDEPFRVNKMKLRCRIGRLLSFSIIEIHLVRIRFLE